MKILPIEDEKMLSDSIKALLGIYDLLILDVMPELPTAATDLAFSLPKGSFRNTKEGSGQKAATPFTCNCRKGNDGRDVFCWKDGCFRCVNTGLLRKILYYHTKTNDSHTKKIGINV